MRYSGNSFWRLFLSKKEIFLTIQNFGPGGHFAVRPLEDTQNRVITARFRILDRLNLLTPPPPTIRFKKFEPGGYFTVLSVLLGTNREFPRNDRPVQKSGSSKIFLFLRGLTYRKNFPNISSLKKVLFVRT